MRGLERFVREDTGAVSAQLALVFPLLLLVWLAGTQVALHLHAVHSAHTVAVQTLAVAQAVDGSSAEASAHGEWLLTGLDSSALRGAELVVDRRRDLATVRVSGATVKLLPMWEFEVRAEVSGPVEQFTNPGAGGSR
ncbi:pilus assembly protein TadE [Lentzea sp. JNUCC 0626]|uniref:pilus assembly protein TadE n=1 Tax=Lentzea sp. JNUCC 0626 TaxID=3367513 RepID=UPI0037490528